ncbi:hypothetical protein [Candidatus Protochlamydia phocaeensis]|uniref:hypothetical protein n=1 Tax=Candidatus Protochlamydia phocaeensis TaxID=1414722 RepID=UPI000838002C|nr:hypothetical protein [Candidatus Protochlamydia phocaeensis]
MPDVNLGDSSNNNFMDFVGKYQSGDGSQGEVDVIGNKDNALIIIKQQDPTKTDTITQMTIIEMQNGRLTGVYSFSATNPSLFPPQDDQTDIDGQGNQGSSVNGDNSTQGNQGGTPAQQLQANPWFNVSFLAVFNNIMTEILGLEQKNHYMEAQTEMQSRVNIIAISQTQSELTKALYDTRAEEKMVEAITSFAQAGMAVVQIGMTWNNASRAEVAANKAMQEDKTALDNALAKHPELGTDINAIKDPPPDVKAHLEAYNKTQTESWRREFVQSKVTEYNRLSDLNNEVVKNAINGVSQTIQAGLIGKEGEIDALKTINDGYLQVLNKYAENTAKSRDDAKANFDRFVDFLMKIVDSDFKAHSIGQGV